MTRGWSEMRLPVMYSPTRAATMTRRPSRESALSILRPLGVSFHTLPQGRKVPRNVAKPASEQAVVERWDAEPTLQEQVPKVHDQSCADASGDCTEDVACFHLHVRVRQPAVAAFGIPSGSRDARLRLIVNSIANQQRASVPPLPLRE